MKTVTTREVQHHFSKVLASVEAGEEVVVTRRGKEVAKLSPMLEVELKKTFKVPDFEAIRRQIGTDQSRGQNEILKQRNESQ